MTLDGILEHGDWDTDPALRFEVGKFYKHTSGKMLHVLSRIKTTLYGETFVAECTCGDILRAVGEDEAAAANWTEATHEEWMTNFS